MGQFYTMLICSIHNSTNSPVTYDLRFDSAGRFEEGNFYYEEYNFTFVFLLTGIKRHNRDGNVGVNIYKEDINELDDFFNNSIIQMTSPYDIVMMNIGLHHNTPISDFLPTTKKYAERYAEMDGFKRPIFIWRETSPQHFDYKDEDAPMGYHVSLTKDPLCYEYPNYTLAYLQDFRNRLAESLMKKYQIPIMRIYNVTRTEYMFHLGPGQVINRYTDCTHFCQESGIYYYFRDLFYNIIPLVIKHREEEIQEWKAKGLTEITTYIPPKRKFEISSD